VSCAFHVNQCLNLAGARRSSAPEVFWSRSGAPVLLSRSKAEHRCKTVSHNLYCVGGAIKPCSINQSNNQETTIALLNGTIDDPLRPSLPKHIWYHDVVIMMSNFEWSYLLKGSSDPHNVLFYRLRFSGSADRIALFLIRSTPRWWL